jgi:hypothetical protein
MGDGGVRRVGAWANRARVARGAELRTKGSSNGGGVELREVSFFLSCNRSRRGERPGNESELGFRSSPDRVVWTGLGLVPNWA